MKKGVSIIELVVSMAIFMVVASLAIGAFITVTRMRGMTKAMKDSQQKMRIVMEMMTRLSRQADKVLAYPESSGSNLDLYFNHDGVAGYESAIRYRVTSTSQLHEYHCSPGGATTCSTWTDEGDLMSGKITFNNATSGFSKTGTIPPRVNFILDGQVVGVPTNSFYYDSLKIDTSVILENLK